MKRSEMTAEQKQRQNRSTAASRDRYNAKNYSKLTIRIRQDGGTGFTLDQIKAAADAAGTSVNGWLTDLIRDNL